MSTENTAPAVAPEAPQADTSGQERTPTDAAIDKPVEGEQATEKAEEPAKKEETEHEKELRRLRNGYERQRTNAARLRAELELLRQQGLTPRTIADNNQEASSNSDDLIPRSEAERLIREESERRAEAKIKGDAMRAVAVKVRAEVGAEKFQEMTEELSGLLDKSKQLAVLRSPDPAGLLRYLTDIDNADEVEAIRAMDDFDTGQAFASIASKLKAAKEKPQPSKAAPVIEPLKGAGGVRDNLPRDDDPIDVWMKKERARMAALNKR